MRRRIKRCRRRRIRTLATKRISHRREVPKTPVGINHAQHPGMNPQRIAVNASNRTRSKVKALIEAHQVRRDRTRIGQIRLILSFEVVGVPAVNSRALGREIGGHDFAGGGPLQKG